MKTVTIFASVFTFLWISFLIGSFFAWLHHVIVCIQNMEWALLAIGGIIFPIGIIHGWGLWFGWFTQ